MIRFSPSSTALLFIPLVAACGFTSGLPADKQGKELSPAENQQFCESQAEYVRGELGEESVKKFACLFGAAVGAVFSGGGEAACQTAFDDCMAKPAEPTASEECPGVSTPGCTATVAELEACVVEGTATIADKIDDATCKTALTDTSLVVPGPKCQLVADKGCDDY